MSPVFGKQTTDNLYGQDFLVQEERLILASLATRLHSSSYKGPQLTHLEQNAPLSCSSPPPEAWGWRETGQVWTQGPRDPVSSCLRKTPRELLVTRSRHFPCEIKNILLEIHSRKKYLKYLFV